jgi:hypothetical protein
MILIRYLLICLVGYLIVRSFVLFGKEDPKRDINQDEKKDKIPSKKVSKKIGEYIDYEEIKKEKSK